MPEPLAYSNGRYEPASQAVVSVFDGGFMQGTTVAEQLRTFGGALFRLEAHVARLLGSLAIIGVEPGLSAAQFVEIAEHLVSHNHALLADGDDLGLTMFVTPGPDPSPRDSSIPTICLHTLPLRFNLWAHKYGVGDALATTTVEQVSARCWPRELKCRSRMHYYLADREACAQYPGSRALLRDESGFVTEATTANVVLFESSGRLVMPPAEKILPGISLGVLMELAAALGVGFGQRDLTTDDVAAADEVFLTSTSPCMLPVVRFNGRAIGAGVSGAMYARLLAAWNELVGLDIARQAERFASR